jgi:hypothetical protein
VRRRILFQFCLRANGLERRYDVFADTAAAARADGAQGQRTRAAGPLDRDRAFAARVAHDGFDLEVFNSTKRNAPALDEGERGAYEIACEPGPDGGR